MVANHLGNSTPHQLPGNYAPALWGYFPCYGDIFLTPKFAGLPPQLVTSNPQAIQQIFTKEKLLTELNSIDITNVDPMEIARLPYLSAICSETLRIYPIAFFPLARITQAPMELIGYPIPAGTILVPCIYLTHHRPDIYPEPNLFRPERFLERQFSPYEYLPFGGGNRRCLGMAFALFEMKVVLATVLSQYSFTLAQKHPVKPVRRSITFVSSGGVRLSVSKRGN